MAIGGALTHHKALEIRPGGIRGKGFGRRGGRGKMFFLQPCLLALLHRESGYGYSLMNGLQDFGFQSEAMDINILYRALRGLEAAGLVSS